MTALNTYEEWEHCITVACDIPLTPAFIESRLAAQNNPRDAHTQRFVETWGESHLQLVVAWFEQARDAQTARA